MKKQMLCILLVLFLLLSVAGCADPGAAEAGGAAPGNGSDTAGDRAAEQDPAGEVRYYEAATEEGDRPVVSRTAPLTEKQAQALREMLDGVDHWYDDRWFDRLQFYFDGEFQFADSDTVYFFSYKSCVIYYFEITEENPFGGYFAEIPERDMDQLRWIGLLG